MRVYLFSKAILASTLILGGVAVVPHISWSQSSRDQYVVVDADVLAEFPQRYWGRGVVFEDVFEARIGRTEQTGGRRFSGILTRRLGRIFVAPGLSSTVDQLQSGRSYLFAGIVVGESAPRIPFMGARTRYWIAIEEIERLVDADEEDWVNLILDSADDHPAFAPILNAVLSTQNQLIARAASEGVSVESLFDPEAPRQDAAISAARNAVRHLSNETGVTAAEYLSVFVRELLALQYNLSIPVESEADRDPPSESEPALEPPDPEPDIGNNDGPEDDSKFESGGDDIDPEESELESQSASVPNENLPTDSDSSYNPAISEFEAEPEPEPSSRWFRRRRSSREIE